jgi:hypothetical protein
MTISLYFQVDGALDLVFGGLRKILILYLMSATIVSCFYFIEDNRKHNIQEYLNWITIFLKYCDRPIVMFTDGLIADKIDVMRKMYFPNYVSNWILIRRPISKLEFSWPEYWKNNHKQDTRNNIQTPDMYRIWANKSQLVEEVAKMNPFNTSHFFWCDAGCWRNEEFAKKYAPGWPSKLEDPLQITWAENFEQFYSEYNNIKQVTIADILKIKLQNMPTVAGGIFGGSQVSVIRFAECIRNTYKLYGDFELFAGDDQAVMASASFIMQHIYGKFAVNHYNSTKYHISGDRWFFFQYYLKS